MGSMIICLCPPMALYGLIWQPIETLKQINGIGPFIEEKLNDLGIYTFEQVSQLDEGLIETLTAAIEFFPGRIERDEWVLQAQNLSENSEGGLSAAVLGGFTSLGRAA
mgnify:CR=1 FL=1